MKREYALAIILALFSVCVTVWSASPEYGTVTNPNGANYGFDVASKTWRVNTVDNDGNAQTGIVGTVVASVPAGVAITLPNFNEILHAVKKTPRWLRLPHIFFLMKTRKIHTGRQTVLGVMPEFRDRGFHAWLVHEQFSEARKLYTDVALGWLEDTNAEIIEICKIVGGETDREWGIFEKNLANPEAAPGTASASFLTGKRPNMTQ
jgi:hypothetical protein